MDSSCLARGMFERQAIYTDVHNTNNPVAQLDREIDRLKGVTMITPDEMTQRRLTLRREVQTRLPALSDSHCKAPALPGDTYFSYFFQAMEKNRPPLRRPERVILAEAPRSF